MIRILIIMLLWLGLAPARAQDVAVPEQEGVARRILVIGDVLAGGLGAGLSRLTEANPQYDVTFRANESSGLARPEIFDWAAAIPNIVEGKSYDAILVMAGSNDRRDIIQPDGTPLAFGTEDWAKAYRGNVDALIDAVKAGGAQIYWAGMPPMGDPEYDAAMQQVSLLQKEQVQAKGGLYIDFHTPLLGADGKYTDMGADDTGTLRKLRSRDGVTFYKQGNNRLAQIVIGAITAFDADLKFEGAGAVAEDKLPAFPIMGRVGADGADVTFDSASLVDVFKKGQQADPAAVAAPAPPPSIAQAGTAAERLYTTGLSAPAPAGRFDDFTVAPAAP